MNILIEYYDWLKWLHFLAFISWMAGLFYLPRLFVYHQENADVADFVRIVKKQERLLHIAISTPAMWATIASGACMIAANSALFSVGYFHLKLTCALLLIIYHFSLGHFLRQLKNDKCARSGKFFRFYNEVPTILLIGIITAMILRPF